MRLVGRWDNPVAVRELRGKGRTHRLLWLLVVTWAILTAAVAGYGVLLDRYGPEIMAGVRDMARQGALPANSGPGIILLAGIAILMSGVAMYAPPALAATVITREREQQSLGLLLISRLHPREVLWGKLVGSTLPVLLALTCALPFLALCSAFGGARLDLVLFVYIKCVLTALATAAIGLACSCLARSTATAVVASYVILFIVLWGLRAAVQYVVLIISMVASFGLSGRSSPNVLVIVLASNLADLLVVVGAGFIAFLIAWSAYRRISEE